MAKVEIPIQVNIPVDADKLIEFLKKDGTLVEVVRCKNCCYWDRETIRYTCNDFKCWNEAVCRQHSIDGNEPHEMWTDADWFCADGERGDPCSSQDS